MEFIFFFVGYYTAQLRYCEFQENQLYNRNFDYTHVITKFTVTFLFKITFNLFLIDFLSKKYAIKYILQKLTKKCNNNYKKDFVTIHKEMKKKN